MQITVQILDVNATGCRPGFELINVQFNAVRCRPNARTGSGGKIGCLDDGSHFILRGIRDGASSFQRYGITRSLGLNKGNVQVSGSIGNGDVAIARAGIDNVKVVRLGDVDHTGRGGRVKAGYVRIQGGRGIRATSSDSRFCGNDQVMPRNARCRVGIIVDLPFRCSQADVAMSLACGDRACGDIAIAGCQRDDIAFGIRRRNNLFRINTTASIDGNGTIGRGNVRQFNGVLFSNVDQSVASHFSRQLPDIRAQGNFACANTGCRACDKGSTFDVIGRCCGIGYTRDGTFIGRQRDSSCL